jgi:hypothetical protein
MKKEPLIKICLPRSVFRECVISALEENVYAQTYFPDLMMKIREAQKKYQSI